MEITYIPIKKLIPNEQNPRKITKDQFQKLVNNIQADPDYFAMRPCLVNETTAGLHVYAGNQRLQAAKKLKWKEVPCIVIKDGDPELIKKRIVLDNIHHGEHDFDLLSSLYDPLELISLGMLEKDLDYYTDDIKDVESQEKESKKKSSMCPACGHEF